MNAPELAKCRACLRVAPLKELLRVRDTRNADVFYVHRPGTFAQCFRTLGPAHRHRIEAVA